MGRLQVQPVLRRHAEKLAIVTEAEQPGVTAAAV
jgi:hypothetical protein